MDDKASNQMTSCAVHHFPKITSELDLHLWVETSCWDGAAAEGSASHVVNHTGYWIWPTQIIMNTEIHSGYDMKHSKNTKERKRIKCWMFHLIGGFFLLHICTEIFAHLCSYLVSKALLKKLPLNIWEGGNNNLNLHIQNTREDRRVDGWFTPACSFH